jgi:hypothetical protein
MTSIARLARAVASATVAAALLVASAATTTGAPADQQHSSLRWFADGAEVSGASAELRRTDSGVGFTLRTRGLTGGDAVTIWWVIFNYPDECEHPLPEFGVPCSVPDLFNPDVAATVMFAAGNVVGASGRTSFAAHLAQGHASTPHPAFADAPGLLNPRGADVHLVVRTHGQLLPQLAKEMIRTFEGGCTPETSDGFGSGPNECADLQFALFAP